MSFSLEGSEEKEVCGEEEVVEEMNKKKHIEAIWEKRREKNVEFHQRALSASHEL